MAESRHPLIERLVTALGFPEVDASSVDEFLAEPVDAVLFFTENPETNAETRDVAVVLPEIVKAFAGRLRPAVVSRAAERELQKRFGFARWPALVFVREGELVGTLTSIHDWSVYLEKVAALPIQSWRYNSETEGVRHLGPVAQDFHAAFGLGENDTSITTVDEGGVALAAIQGLNEKVESGKQKAESRIEWLEQTLQQKQTEIAELKQRLDKLERFLNHKMNGGGK
jgi:hydrogenase-1 operon protein HyaE